MSDCLIVMNPRNTVFIRRALEELPIDKIWLTGWTEKQLAEGVFLEAISEFNYDQYLMASDDIIIREDALTAVRRLLDAGHPVATGYSQRSHTEWVVNVTSGPLRGEEPGPDAYTFRMFQDVVSWADPAVPTWFTGMSLTAMSRELWLKYPFGCYSSGHSDPGWASDFHLSRRLQDDNVPIVAAREGFCYHWRNDWQRVGPTDDPLVVGKVIPSISLTQGRGALVRA